jgi:hypothetical protein
MHIVEASEKINKGLVPINIGSKSNPNQKGFTSSKTPIGTIAL